MANVLVEVAEENFDYFKARNKVSDHNFSESFQNIIDVVTQAEPIVEQIKAFAPQYDFDKISPANGYRGFALVYDLAVEKTLKISQTIRAKRESCFFKSTSLQK
jgi:hypothetical protein